MKKKVVVGKIDLDTVLTAYIGHVDENDEIIVVRGEAEKSDLENRNVLCIEVGGSGEVEKNNFDHHDPEGPTDSASKQAWGKYCKKLGIKNPNTFSLNNLVNYVDRIDTQGIQADSGIFPSLMDVFSGMLLTERDSKKQLLKGINIIREVVLQELIRTTKNRLAPMPNIPSWTKYISAKNQHDEKKAEVVEKSVFTETTSGHKLAYVETDFFGAPGALYEVGADIVIAFNPDFNGVRKFTIAGKNVRVDVVKSELDEKEIGWGGPPTGTILGSPREEGSCLSLEDVIKIVKKI